MCSSELPQDLSCVLVYPNSREVAFASLGFLKVFDMLRRRVRLADLSYMPGGHGDGRSLPSRARSGGARRAPGQDVLSPRQGLLLGLATRNQVRDFDVVAFSVSYENDAIRLPELLIKAGMPALAAARQDLFPLVICGGFAMSINPLPVADFVDAVVVGEFEPVVDRLVATIAEARLAARGRAGAGGGGSARSDLLRRLARLEGVYVPGAGQTAVRRIWAGAEEIAPEPSAEARSHFGDMLLVEVGRGCGRGCLFCAPGHLYRPVRMRRAETILDQVGSARVVGLVGTAVGDHPALERLLETLVESGRRIGVSSFRADEITPEIAGMLAEGGVRTLAIAPEAGSEALRRRVGKDISDQELTDAVGMLAEAGIRIIKLYFMIGLPGESDADAEAIVGLTRRLAEARGKARLAVAVGPFVPKPHTVFQWSAFAGAETLKRRAALLGSIRRIRGCSLKIGSIEEAWLEAVLARADRSVGSLLLEAAQERIPVGPILRRAGHLDPTRALDMEKPLPWDFIKTGVSAKRLRTGFLEFQRG
ncbi:MAG: radical SAM protein [bacterium]